MLAIALLVGFYVLGVAVAGFLLWVPYAEYRYLNRVDLRLVLWCGGGAGAILLSFRPRRDPFSPPGPELREVDHPDLFKLIREVAADTHQEMPAAVYLVPALNAFVQQRGGVSGVGTQRIMGLGSPLLQKLNASELKAVLAHEFGHYVAGDVALGPIVYRTGQSIARTNEAVRGSIVSGIFALYASLFLRISMKVSRHQEFLADRLAAAVAGAAPMKSGLEKLPGTALAYQLYLAHEVLPVLREGVVPPITHGFVTFLDQPKVRTLSQDRGIADAIPAGPYDSHPALRDRLAALDSLGQPPALVDTRSAAALLRRHDWDLELADHLFPADKPRRLVTWDATVEAVRMPAWRQMTNVRRKRLATIACDDLPGDIASAAALSRRIKETIDTGEPDAEAAGRLAGLMTMAIGLRLHDLGWQFHYQPGQPIIAERNGASLDLFGTVREVMTGVRTLDDWRRFCRDAGLAGQPLVAA